MEQDRDYWPKVGPTGDPEEDRQRKKAVLNRLSRIVKDYNLGQVDLLSDLNGAVIPDKKTKRESDRRAVMIAYAFGLDDHIPLELAKKVGLEPGPNPPTNHEDDGTTPF